jgi:DNA mismatch endonuclease (patch repair protein)
MSIKYPSYKGLKPASETASKAKRSNTRTDTKPELMLRKELWRNGLRFRKNVKDLPGKPDIVFTRSRIVVFCDGDFWHGRNWEERKNKLKSGANADYWIAKIQANIDRDIRNTKILEDSGWQVIRFWEHDIKQNLLEIVDQIKVSTKQ